MDTFKNSCRSLLRFITGNKFCVGILLDMVRKGILPGWIWRRLPVEGTFLVHLRNGVIFKYAVIANDIIGRALFWRGFESYEPATVNVFCKLSQKSNIILDIGANTGLFTLIAGAANPNSKIISFEPVPHIYNRLMANININGWQHRCQARNEAVSNIVGSAKFHVPFGDLPSSASLHIQGFRNLDGYLIDVPIVTIDAICSKGQKIDLVKIDVEGFEDKVLEGMQYVLAESAPSIIVECNPDGPYQAVEAILAGFGYSFFHLRQEGAVAVEKIVPDASQRYRNFLGTVHDNWIGTH